MNYTRADLEKLVQSKFLTQEGKNWLMEVTDPFHDDNLELTGFPDTNLASSVVQLVKKSQTITAPSAISGNWDCNVVLWPMPMQTKAETPTSAALGLHDCTAAQFLEGPQTVLLLNDTSFGGPQSRPYAIGGVTALACASGGLTYGALTSQNAIYDLSSLTLDPSYLDGSCRVIGMGYEVVNTTSELYSQGQATVYRQPVPADNWQAILCGGFDGSSPINYLNGQQLDVYPVQRPPGSQQEAMLLSGSRQWHAKLGSYGVATMNKLDNEARQFHSGIVACLSDDYSDAIEGDPVVTNAVANGYYSSSVVLSTTPALVIGSVNSRSQHIAPFNLSGTYFTGLSTQTTLTISVNWYIERFPTPAELDLVVLASPSPHFDSFAIELYGQALCDLAPGVPQGQNPLGEWFRDVIHKIASVAEPVLQAITPVFPMAGPASLIASGVRQLTSKQSNVNKRKPKKQVLSKNVNSDKITVSRRGRD